MNISDISTPDIYRSSADFRFFLKWAEMCLTEIQYDTDHLIDCYDPLRCKKDMLWMLADTMGFKYDDRILPAYNRLVLLYFMSMIYNRGSLIGMTLAGEVNLKQFDVLATAQENEDEIYQDRLGDTNLPVNSVYIEPHTPEGYINLIYFSEELPIDACIEYVRPLGMFLFAHAGVRVDARTKISIDPKLAEVHDSQLLDYTRIGHYTRTDYASMQMQEKNENDNSYINSPRALAYKTNATYEVNPSVDAGYRALSNLELTNNEHMIKSLLPKVFKIGYGPQTTSDTFNESYMQSDVEQLPTYNLQYDKNLEEAQFEGEVYTIDPERATDILTSKPRVNPVMTSIGDAICLDATNTDYIEHHDIQTPETILYATLPKISTFQNPNKALYRFKRIPSNDYSVSIIYNKNNEILLSENLYSSYELKPNTSYTLIFRIKIESITQNGVHYASIADKSRLFVSTSLKNSGLNNIIASTEVDTVVSKQYLNYSVSFNTASRSKIYLGIDNSTIDTKCTISYSQQDIMIVEG